MEWIAGLVSAALVGIAGVIAALYKRNQNRKDQYTHEERLIELSQNLENSNKILKDFTSLSRDFDYVKKGMNALHKEIKEIKSDVNELKENCSSTDRMLLAREITSIYADWVGTKEIPQREYESALNLYDVYSSIGGNGYISSIVSEIKTWKRI